MWTEPLAETGMTPLKTRNQTLFIDTLEAIYPNGGMAKGRLETNRDISSGDSVSGLVGLRVVRWW